MVSLTGLIYITATTGVQLHVVGKSHEPPGKGCLGSLDDGRTGCVLPGESPEVSVDASLHFIPVGGLGGLQAVPQ